MSTGSDLCGQCRHWQLVGDLGRYGYGQCAMRSERTRAIHTTSAQCPCRVGRFAPKVEAPKQP